MSCWGFLGLPFPSAVLGPSGFWENAAGSSWPPRRAPGFSCHFSPSLLTTFVSSKPAKGLRKNERPYGASIVGLVPAHPLQADLTIHGYGSSPPPGGWYRKECSMSPISGSSLFLPQEDLSTATPFPLTKAIPTCGR